MSPRPISTEAELRMRNRALQRRLDAHQAAVAVIPIAYLEALSALAHVAINGLRRPEDLGGTITGTHGTSTGSRLPSPAYGLLQVEVEKLAAAAKRLDLKLNEIDPPQPGESEGITVSTNGRNPTKSIDAA
jgi:hypothetical protein